MTFDNPYTAAERDVLDDLQSAVKQMRDEAREDRQEHLGDNPNEYAEAVGRSEALTDVLKLLREREADDD